MLLTLVKRRLPGWGPGLQLSGLELAATSFPASNFASVERFDRFVLIQLGIVIHMLLLIAF